MLQVEDRRRQISPANLVGFWAYLNTTQHSDRSISICEVEFGRTENLFNLMTLYEIQELNRFRFKSAEISLTLYIIYLPIYGIRNNYRQLMDITKLQAMSNVKIQSRYPINYLARYQFEYRSFLSKAIIKSYVGAVCATEENLNAASSSVKRDSN